MLFHIWIYIPYVYLYVYLCLLTWLWDINTNPVSSLVNNQITFSRWLRLEPSLIHDYHGKWRVDDALLPWFHLLILLFIPWLWLSYPDSQTNEGLVVTKIFLDDRYVSLGRWTRVKVGHPSRDLLPDVEARTAWNLFVRASWENLILGTFTHLFRTHFIMFPHLETS